MWGICLCLHVTHKTDTWMSLCDSYVSTESGVYTCRQMPTRHGQNRHIPLALSHTRSRAHARAWSLSCSRFLSVKRALPATFVLSLPLSFFLSVFFYLTHVLFRSFAIFLSLSLPSTSPSSLSPLSLFLPRTDSKTLCRVRSLVVSPCLLLAHMCSQMPTRHRQNWRLRQP